MQEELTTLVDCARQSINQANDLDTIEHLRLQYLGKKGQLTELLKGLGKASAEERPRLGKDINIAKQEIQALLTEQIQSLQHKVLQQQIEAEKIDVTLPGRGQQVAALHPVTRVRERVVELFQGMGFRVAEGPEIEDDFHNFAALNIPQHHPARDSQDTFYFADGRVLRTHTSPVQIRVMENERPPLRVITPGRVFRHDFDTTHTPMFHQLEGLAIDTNITFGELKSLLHEFMAQFFEAELKLRFRPSYFPFTEPSAEVDIEHLLCKGKGCRTCGNSGWLEVLGCGMVHPNVLRNVNIDPDEFTGFAFGIGLDRMAMLRYGIDDLRKLFENDLRLLEQF